MSLILAIDQGTSSSRGIVFDMADGRIVGIDQQAFDMEFPHDGWVEQDPEVLWWTTIEAARAAIASAGVTAHEISAIGITNQRETTLVWDRNSGECVHNAIVWQDRRTAEHCQRMAADGLAESVRAKTGLVLDPYFSGTKLAWLLDQVPGLRRRAAAGELCFGTVDSFLLWRLTGGRAHLTDATNASRTQLFDINQQRWDPELLDYFDIPEALLPEVCDSAHAFGTADAEWFGAPIPIAGMAGDQQAALIGQGCLAEGTCKSTYGTGCFVMTNTGAEPRPSGNGLLTTLAYRLQGQATYALEGSIFVAGLAVKWLRDQLGLVDDAAQTESLARSVDGDAQGVYFVPAFTGLGAPHWSPNARGTLTGLTSDTHSAHIVTAALQSVGFQTAELLDAMAADGAAVTRLGVDGGMVANDWLCQFLADVLDRPVNRPQTIETTALGAAMLAAAGPGGDLGGVHQAWGQGHAFTPNLAPAKRTALLEGWRRAVRQTLAGT
ncbi:MAG: glycerol kinase GlpK [Gammaproteobacteria bacterium]|nr:glycerol kinase GlpK [Gammaproteobacteria bacterium]